MRKAIAGLAMTGVLVLTMVAGASAAPRNGHWWGHWFGANRVIRQQCGMSYGRIVFGIWTRRLERPPVRLRGPVHFVRSGLIDLYCPVEPVEPEQPEEPEPPGTIG
jgi:hypothetical protein